jgi:hypothetical protein
MGKREDYISSIRPVYKNKGYEVGTWYNKYNFRGLFIVFTFGNLLLLTIGFRIL